MTTEVTKEEFLAWKNDRVTREVFGMIEAVRAEYVDALTTGKTLQADTTELTVGRIAAYDDLLRIEYDSVEEPEHD